MLIVFALVIGPWLFTRHPPGTLTSEQELKARNDVRTTLVQALAGLAVAGGLVVTYRQTGSSRTAATSGTCTPRPSSSSDTTKG